MSVEDPEDDEFQPRWKELITLQEAAKLSGLSYSHLRLLARQDQVWAKKLGNTWFTTARAVKDYMARDRRPGPKSQTDS